MNSIKGKKIAVVGVSKDENKFGHRIFKDLLNNGYNVKAVGRQEGFILGEKLFSKLSELKERPDVVITVVPPNITEKIVEECVELGIKEIWMQPGSESKKAIEQAKKAGIKIVSKKCIMVEEGIW